jgi:hypothetical protein
MNQDSKEKLEVSRDVVEQLNAMVRNCATSVGNGQGPSSPGPPPNPRPSIVRDEYED